jgi:hypothetical protein
MILNKVKIYDKILRDEFAKVIALLSSVATLLFVFVNLPNEWKINTGILFTLILISIYVYMWIKANNIKDVTIDIEGSEVIIKVGDIFEKEGFKVIAFNEYFDTQVDDKIISSKTLNGIYLNKYFPNYTKIVELNQYINRYAFKQNNLLEENIDRKEGKKQKFQIGTICLYDDFILTAFTKFDEENKAILTMLEYLEFLIKFWDEINRVYAQKNVSVPILGSGITRIKEHKSISDEELLKIMLWTFRISEMRFKYPAKLIIVIHKDKINQINLLDIKNGL